MKVKDLLKVIDNYRKIYKDIDEWKIYTEQPDLMAPLDNLSFERYFELNTDENDEEYKEIKRSYDVIKRLEKAGWNFLYDSEGWVYRDVAGDHTLFSKDKVITINNNY